jgi:hypothetical protein
MLPGDAANPHGYFEDLEFLELHQRMLPACTPSDDGGHRDWGWTEHEKIDRSGFSAFEADARALVQARQQAGRPWGWKDPRTTVTLDFWDAILGDAQYIFVYRFPWEVADSMQRLGAEIFLRRPDYAYRIWSFYNRQLLDFARRHRARSLIVSANTVVREPERFVNLLHARGGVQFLDTDVCALVDGTLFRRQGTSDSLARMATGACPDCATLLAELESAADLSSDGV